MPASPVARPLSAGFAKITTRPISASRLLLLLALVLTAAALLAGGVWGPLALCVGLPAAILGYALELRRLWTSVGGTGG